MRSLAQCFSSIYIYIFISTYLDMSEEGVAKVQQLQSIFKVKNHSNISGWFFLFGTYLLCEIWVTIYLL